MLSVITGAARGIGLEFVAQLLARGGEVVAAARDPHAPGLAALAAGAGARLVQCACDVTDDASVRGLTAALADRPVDLLVNNAGVYGGDHQQLGDVDFEDAVRTFQVNALGALRVTFALLPHLRRGTGRKVVHVTSGMGSIDDNTSGGFYAYRMSKAALNMAARCLAVDLRRERIASAVINPGWVRTDMGGPGAPTAADESVTGMLREIDRLTIERSGSFLDWRGRSWTW